MGLQNWELSTLSTEGCFLWTSWHQLTASQASFSKANSLWRWSNVGHGQGQGTETANKKQSVMDQWLAWQNTSIQHTRNFSPCILTLLVIGWETLCPLFNLLEHWAPPWRRSITTTGLRSLGAIVMGFKNLDKKTPEKETGPSCLWKQNIAFKGKAKLAASVLGETSNKEKGPG